MGRLWGYSNSDDLADSSVLAQVCGVFKTHLWADMVYADLAYVKWTKIVYHYVGGYFSKKGFYGRVSAHSTLFVRRKVYTRFGDHK
ncbi:hypothetical protein NHP190012_15480 [Helicobacter sp. NHP19-012]|uniref:Transposase IS4-like domain-containing protein n=1 Tax=Helicobacter gastrofelis TaxID=2849642 RepID=A0ABN6I8I8_9HELI|nr:hypothetical protein NHP190012_15480 [Helicobacter sp. NHP19-012]